MSTTHNLARKQLTGRVLSATSLSEVLAAKQELREWIQTHPEERDQMSDGFEQLSHMEDIGRERAALPAEQREMRQRLDCLIGQVYDAYTLPDVAAAQEAIDEWLAAYPEDEGIESARRYLTTMQELVANTEEQKAADSLQPAA